MYPAGQYLVRRQYGFAFRCTDWELLREKLTWKNRFEFEDHWQIEGNCRHTG